MSRHAQRLLKTSASALELPGAPLPHRRLDADPASSEADAEATELQGLGADRAIGLTKKLQTRAATIVGKFPVAQPGQNLYAQAVDKRS